MKFVHTEGSLPLPPEKIIIEIKKYLKLKHRLMSVQQASFLMSKMEPDTLKNISQQVSDLTDKQAQTFINSLLGLPVILEEKLDYEEFNKLAAEASSINELQDISNKIDEAFLSGDTKVTGEQWAEFTETVKKRVSVIESGKYNSFSPM